MRHQRAAKFAEYVSTYAILHHVGLHQTTLIERRDSSVGVGVFVRDACDAGTTLLVVPSKRLCTCSTLERIGTSIALASTTVSDTSRSQWEDLDNGIVTFLTGSTRAVTWVEWCWRLALERHRSYSHWWGWLQSLPGPKDFAELRDSANQQCRLHHVPIVPFYRKACKAVEENKRRAYELLAADNLRPSWESFAWAVDVLLSRGGAVMEAWPARSSGRTENEGGVEVGVVPYVDLVNGPDDAGRRVNSEVELAFTVEDLPDWYVAWMTQESLLKGRDPAADVQQLFEEQRYCACLTTTQPLTSAEEAIVKYQSPCITTGVLSEDDDATLTRLLRFYY